MDLDDERQVLTRRVDALTTQLHDLSVRHYRQVVDARESLQRASAAGARLETECDALAGEELPALRGALAAFMERGRALAEAHKRTSLTVDLHSQLVDLLGMPQLMDTCARGGAVDEALELCAFARTLRARHHAIAESAAAAGAKRGRAGALVVDAVANEVEASAAQLRRQLLQQLRGHIDLPSCLRVVSFLKRLDAQRLRAIPSISSSSSSSATASASTSLDPEDELRREFLECRDAYLRTATVGDAPHSHSQAQAQTQTQQAPTGPYQLTLRAIQRNREVWFDVITQYLAIFDGERAHETLARWVGFKVEEFTHSLASNVSRFESCGELATVLELATSFAASLARVGCDFRALLPQMFLDRAVDLMRAQWGAAAAVALDSIASGDWGEPLPSALRPGASAFSSSSSSSSSSSAHDYAPPPALLDFPVAVDFCNAMLRSLNELRSFACLELVPELAVDFLAALEAVVRGAEEFDSMMASAAGDIGAGGGANANGAPNKHQTRFDALVGVLARHLLPYLSRCFSAVFGNGPAVHVDVAALVARLDSLSRVPVAAPAAAPTSSSSSGEHVAAPSSSS